MLKKLLAVSRFAWTGGTDGKGGAMVVGGAAPWIRRAGDDLMPLSEYLDAGGTSVLFPEAPIPDPDGLWRFACLVDDRHGPYQSGSSGGQGPGHVG